MSSGIEDRLEDIAELCCCYGVARLAVFGSATTDAFDEGASDIDLLVDLVVRSGVRNPYFLRRATESSEILYAS